jgi:hypothetical protein
VIARTVSDSCQHPSRVCRHEMAEQAVPRVEHQPAAVTPELPAERAGHRAASLQPAELEPHAGFRVHAEATASLLDPPAERVRPAGAEAYVSSRQVGAVTPLEREDDRPRQDQIEKRIREDPTSNRIDGLGLLPRLGVLVAIGRAARGPGIAIACTVAAPTGTATRASAPGARASTTAAPAGATTAFHDDVWTHPGRWRHVRRWRGAPHAPHPADVASRAQGTRGAPDPGRDALYRRRSAGAGRCRNRSTGGGRCRPMRLGRMR